MKVYQAINAVQRALSKIGIGKDSEASGFGQAINSGLSTLCITPYPHY